MSTDRPDTSASKRPPTAADKPMTRRGCLMGVALWLLVMTLPVCALLLAVRGELSWRRGPFVEDRVWIVSLESGPEAEQGLAYSQTRMVPGGGAADAPVCAQTRVYFWLWQGESEALAYCECYRPTDGGQYESLGACP